MAKPPKNIVKIHTSSKADTQSTLGERWEASDLESALRAEDESYRLEAEQILSGKYENPSAAIIKNDYSYISEDKSVTAATTKGQKADQQDAFMVGFAQNPQVALDPTGFFKRSIKKIVADHESCSNGTTLCAALVMSADSNPKIVTANLGDSRAMVLVKFKTADGTIDFRQINLTADHDLESEEMRKYIIDHGGKITNRSKTTRVNYGLNMGAAIGDSTVGATIVNGRLDDCLWRDPEVRTHNFLDLVNAGETILEAQLIAASDGLMEEQSEDFIKDAWFEFEKLTPSPSLNFSDFLKDYVYQRDSQDNITLACTTLVSDGFLVKRNKPLMITVCDGHGHEQNPKNFTDDKKNWDGAAIAASVVASLNHTAQTVELKGIEVLRDNKLVKHFADKAKIPTVPDAALQTKPIIDQIIDAAQRKIETIIPIHDALKKAVTNLKEMTAGRVPPFDKTAEVKIAYQEILAGVASIKDPQEKIVLINQNGKEFFAGEHLFGQAYEKIFYAIEKHRSKKTPARSASAPDGEVLQVLSPKQRNS